MRRRLKITKYPIRKALMKEAGLPQALHLWRKKLKLDQYGFKDPKSFTEKEVSVKTWDGCTTEEYEANHTLYKRWNDRVINYWHELDNRARIIRIRDIETQGPNAGQQTTKICRSDNRRAIKRLTHKTSIAAGMIVSAINDNEIYQLEQNIGRLVMDKTISNVKALPGRTEEDIKKLISALTTEQAIEAGKLIGKTEVAQSVLSVLDMRPALIAIDQANEDKYSKDADHRRKNTDGGTHNENR